jgi:hypothetical protein
MTQLLPCQPQLHFYKVSQQQLNINTSSRHALCWRYYLFLIDFVDLNTLCEDFLLGATVCSLCSRAHFQPFRELHSALVLP